MLVTRIAIASISALVSLATSASADFRYTGSPKLGQFYVDNSPMSARAEFVPENRVTAPVPVPSAPTRKGGISARGI
jgi:hypothetical protein